MTYSTENFTMTIPLSSADRQLAEQFARGQHTAEKAMQVRQNTLAVLTVYHYLQLLDISTDLDHSYSWNPVGRLCADVADLKLAAGGRLECRPVTSVQHICAIPPDVWTDRLAYLVVKLDDTHHQGVILGFTPTATEAIALHELHPLSNLLTLLHPTAPLAAPLAMPLVRLSQWLEEQFTEGWQAIDQLLDTRTSTPVLAFRNQLSQAGNQTEALQQFVRRLYRQANESNLPALEDPIAALVHLLQMTDDDELRWTVAEALWTIAPNHPAVGVRRVMDLGMQLGGQAIALMVAILPRPDQSLSILLRVYPIGNQPYLPPGLQIRGLDQAGNQFLEATTRSRDDYIQLKFGADLGEHFSMQLTLAEASVVEHFIV